MITLPNKPKIIEQKDNWAVFEIDACYPGYGVGLGNIFRRVLLSSLPGVAVTGMKIKGVQHEFSAIPHVVENAIQIILNLKQVRFKSFVGHDFERVFKATLKVKGEKELKAGDIKTGPELEVINKKAHIATLTDKKADFDMELEIECGLGYVPTERRKKKKLEIGKIALDAIFSPVKRVNYTVEDMRVGERTDYDKLRIKIETDGTIDPKNAFLKAGQILVDHYQAFTSLAKKEKKSKIKEENIIKKEDKKVVKKSIRSGFEEIAAKMKISDLKISQRTISVLEDNGFKTVAGLIKKSEEDLKEVKGLGNKAIVEIKRAVGKLGLTLKL